MSTCAAPASSPCRTGKGKVAIQYHTARFRLVPQLAKALSVPKRCFFRRELLGPRGAAGAVDAAAISAGARSSLRMR
ncbi:hypothetical protein SSPS47_06970 [Streptomyces sp. S4.7]|nr:hypothetical protein SSPS47_06970 [Streptomyces sp. S4.7]